jgi:hypothetical protein
MLMWRSVYAPVSIQFPGSFKAKTIKSLWKDQTYTKNYAGIISMDSLIDYAKILHKESTTTLFADEHTYREYLSTSNSTTESSMNIDSKFDGSAHLGVTIADVSGDISDVNGDISGIPKSKANSNGLMDEDYKGSFSLTKKMDVILKKTTDYGDYETNIDGFYEDYPWLPCACNAGWGDMTIHDQRYHSAKGFFDCTACLPPGPCKN